MNEKDNRGTAGPYANLEQDQPNGPFPADESKTQNPRVNILVRSLRKLKSDPDGVSVKAALDGIVALGILPDDSSEQVESITFKTVKSKEEKTIIEITEV